MRALLQKICVLAVLTVSVASLALVLPLQTQTAEALGPPSKVKSDASKLYTEAVVNGTVTQQPFQPRGANYVRLSPLGTGSYHSTFEPGKYDLAAARAFLAQIEHDKYNVVRVFIDPGNTDATNPHGIGRGMGTYDQVYGPYMDNFASFVNEAAARGIYVLPSLDVFPQNSYYWDIVAAKLAGVGTPNMGGRNLSYMDKGRIAAKAEYMKNFAAALVERVGDNKTAILAYQADNEVYFETNKAPFNKMTGTVTPVDGLTYDMSKPADRQQAADASMVAYSALAKQGLLKSDPDALMTMGFFTLRAVGKTSFNGMTTNVCETNCPTNVNYWVPGRPAALSAWGKADFLDIHIYPPSATYSPTSDLNGMEKSSFRKPYIIGEFGAKKSVYSNDLTKAAYAMRDFRIATCQQGAQGWIFWTWDTYENLASQDLFYKMTENHGAINGQLAPIAQPDPCSATTIPVSQRKAFVIPKYSVSPYTPPVQR
jgi:hypothetical protein